MSLYMHFRKEEHPFVDQVIEWKRIVLDQYRPKLSDFLDPRQQEIVRSIIGQHEELKVSYNGGHDGAERQRCLLYPAYFAPENGDFEIELFEVNYPKKFVTIEHRQILGALMNIGLKREKFGDILTDGERYQIVVANEVSDFIKWNFTSVGKAKVSLESNNFSDILSKKEEYTYKDITVSSLRLDVVIAELYKLSRTKVKPMIETGYVKVNWKIVDDSSFHLQGKDVISVRGKGRAEIVSNEGNTKKGKMKLRIRFPQ